ncbi:MAG: helix-turn-helix domain-containing protein [Lachnospiraceae bacterium]|nr:helix-turn-helix domain-containing protein [Lachnospiraceae bacterium]
MRTNKKKNTFDRSSMKDFNTIRETAVITGLSEKYLRRLQKENKLPGVYSGTRFLVNYASLIRYLSDSEPEGWVRERGSE